MFADDVALSSTTPSGLPSQLDCLKTCRDQMKLEVNKDKTKITVFRKGLFFWLGMRNVFYDDTRLGVVNKYCYLGFNFTAKMG